MIPNEHSGLINAEGNGKYVDKYKTLFQFFTSFKDFYLFKAKVIKICLRNINTK